jgi:hypothetical protein
MTKFAKLVLRICRRLENKKSDIPVVGPVPVYPGNEVMGNMRSS